VVGSAFQAPFSDRGAATGRRAARRKSTVVEVPVAAAQTTPDRGEKMAATRAKKMTDLFEGQKYRILAEIHLGADEQYMTPFGNRGRHGYVLKNTDTGVKIMVGETVLRQAASVFDAILDLPPIEPKRKRRTRAEKAADDARIAAERVAHMDALLARFE
jgi:hypothetical protein